MGLAGIFTGTIGLIIVLIVLYCLHKNKINKASERIAAGVGDRVDGWLTSGGYLRYYMT
jgi:hypothetical protein